MRVQIIRTKVTVMKKIVELDDDIDSNDIEKEALLVARLGGWDDIVDEPDRVYVVELLDDEPTPKNPLYS